LTWFKPPNRIFHEARKTAPRSHHTTLAELNLTPLLDLAFEPSVIQNLSIAQVGLATVSSEVLQKPWRMLAWFPPVSCGKLKPEGFGMSALWSTNNQVNHFVPSPPKSNPKT
jgi:hypothetical protein